MAVGKGSMARAAKSAVSGTPSETKEKPAAKTAKPSAKTAAKTAKPSAGAVSKEEVSKQIVYEKNQGMLERDAEPNERFGVGDAMPVYYF